MVYDILDGVLMYIPSSWEVYTYAELKGCMSYVLRMKFITVCNLGDSPKAIEMLKDMISKNRLIGDELHLVSIRCSGEVVRLLLNHGVDIDRSDSRGNTAVSIATINRNLSALTELLEWCPELDTQNDAGHAPVHIAASNPDTRFISSLLRWCPTLTYHHLNIHDIVYDSNNLPVAKLLFDFELQKLRCGAPSCVKKYVPLAVRLQDHDFAEALLKVDDVHKYEHDVVSYALSNRDERMLALLLSYGLSFNTTSVRKFVYRNATQLLMFSIADERCSTFRPDAPGEKFYHSGNFGISDLTALIQGVRSSAKITCEFGNRRRAAENIANYLRDSVREMMFDSTITLLCAYISFFASCDPKHNSHLFNSLLRSIRDKKWYAMEKVFFDARLLNEAIVDVNRGVRTRVMPSLSSISYFELRRVSVVNDIRTSKRIIETLRSNKNHWRTVTSSNVWKSLDIFRNYKS